MSPDKRNLDETDIQEVVDIGMTGKANVVLDATILSTLMACPRLADFKFNHNLYSISGKSNSLEIGSIVHTFLEYYHKSLIKGVKREQAIQFGFSAAEMYIRGCHLCTDFTPYTDSDGNIVAKPQCGHKPNEFPGVKNTPRDSEGYRIGWQYALDTCDQYIQFYRNDHWVPLEAEVVKGKVLYEDSEVRILWKAKLDLVADTNQGIYPIDHKTMRQRRDTVILNNQFIGQCLVMDTRRMFINKIGFQTTLKPEEKFTREVCGYTASQLLEWQGETLPFYAKLLLMYAEGGHYPPNFSSCDGKYGKCAFYDVCKVDQNMREEELKNNFKVGPEWNPTNDLSESE